MGSIDSVIGPEQINTQCTRQIHGVLDSRVIVMVTGGLDKPSLFGLLMGGQGSAFRCLGYLLPTLFL